jgi:hypothetical protein
MQMQKMSLASIQGKLSRAEMKGIMAGSTYGCACVCSSGAVAICPGNCNTSACFNSVYSTCGGHPASYCVTGGGPKQI